MIAAAIAVALATTAAHAPAWRGAFVGDDISEIVENPAIRVLWPPWVPMMEGTPLPHRPLPYYTFALNYAVHGLDPRGYHAVNIAIHFANGWLVWWVGREVLRRLGARDAAGEIALAAASIWLVHPLCTQAVDYLYQRIELLGALAILGVVALFLRATIAPQPKVWLIASVAASAAGMLCKEHVVAAPAAVLLIDWLAVGWRQTAPWRSLVEAVQARPAYYAALFATPLIAVGLVILQRDRFTDFRQPLAGPLVYAVNQPLVIGEYLIRAAWPARLCIDWYRLPVTSPALLVPGVGALVLTLALAGWGVRHAHGLTLGILLFLGLLAPTSSVLPVNDLMVEHRMYLPLAVLSAALCAVGHGLITRHVPFARRGAMAFGITVLLIVALAATTWSRCHAYQSRLVMWADVVSKAPLNPRGWQTLAVELWQAGALDRALEAVGRSLAITPEAAVSLATREAILREIDRRTKAESEQPAG